MARTPRPGDTAVLAATWLGKAVSCELLYEAHPAAGSFAHPGEAVLGRGSLGHVQVTHSVSSRGEDFYLWADGPEELDPCSGGAFILSTEGASLQEAVDAFERGIRSVQSWCDEVRSSGAGAPA